MRDIGKIIQLHLDEMNMTQTQLGQLIGVSQQTISLIINNRRLPSLDLLVQICNILNIDISSLLDINVDSDEHFVIEDVNEKRIIECYRSLNEDEKGIFNAFVTSINHNKK